MLKDGQKVRVLDAPLADARPLEPTPMPKVGASDSAGAAVGTGG
jgi:hypothetical protein